MSTKTDEALYIQLRQGMEASGALGVVLPLLVKRRDTLISTAVAAHNCLIPDRKLTDRGAALFVAALAETYQLEHDLQRAIDDGQKAGQHFTK